MHEMNGMMQVGEQVWQTMLAHLGPNGHSL